MEIVSDWRAEFREQWQDLPEQTGKVCVVGSELVMDVYRHMAQEAGVEPSAVTKCLQGGLVGPITDCERTAWRSLDREIGIAKPNPCRTMVHDALERDMMEGMPKIDGTSMQIPHPRICNIVTAIVDTRINGGVWSGLGANASEMEVDFRKKKLKPSTRILLETAGAGGAMKTAAKVIELIGDQLANKRVTRSFPINTTSDQVQISIAKTGIPAAMILNTAGQTLQRKADATVLGLYGGDEVAARIHSNTIHTLLFMHHIPKGVEVTRFGSETLGVYGLLGKGRPEKAREQLRAIVEQIPEAVTLRSAIDCGAVKDAAEYDDLLRMVSEAREKEASLHSPVALREQRRATREEQQRKARAREVTEWIREVTGTRKVVDLLQHSWLANRQSKRPTAILDVLATKGEEKLLIFAQQRNDLTQTGVAYQTRVVSVQGASKSYEPRPPDDSIYSPEFIKALEDRRAEFERYPRPIREASVAWSHGSRDKIVGELGYILAHGVNAKGGCTWYSPIEGINPRHAELFLKHQQKKARI